MPSNSGAKVITLISAIFFISSINSFVGFCVKAGCAPSLLGLIKGPSRWIPKIFVVFLLFSIKSFKPFNAWKVSSRVAVRVVGSKDVVPFLSPAVFVEKKWINNNFDCEFYAGLRSAYSHNNKINIYAGAGITIDSDPNEELNEINSKFKSIDEIINE